MLELSRSLQPRHITMISIGGIIGAGLFVGSSASIAATGPAVVLSYLITGTLVLLVMRMLGEMALALPSVRSFTEFARAGLGPWAGFVAGWLYWYFWIIVVPVEAIAGARILADWLGFPAWLLGLVLMGIMTAVNLMSARSYGEFEFWFASIKVAAIIVFIALAAAFACGLTAPTGPTFSNLTAYGGFIFTAVLSCLNSAFYVCSRVLFVLAEHGDAPQWLVQLNARRVPTRSVWMGSLAGVLGILAAIAAPQTVFAFLVNASGALSVFVYIIIAAAHIRLRREREARGVPEPALTMWLFPWASWAAILGMVAVLAAMALTPGEMSRQLFWSLVSLAVAVGAFLIVNGRRKAREALPLAPAAPRAADPP